MTLHDFPRLSTTLHDFPRLSATFFHSLAPHFQSPHGFAGFGTPELGEGRKNSLSSVPETYASKQYTIYSEFRCDTNQYRNNSPGVLSCIRTGANTGAACIRTEMTSPKNLEYAENSSSKIFSCIHKSANTGPSCIHAKIIPQDLFLACIGSVPGVFGLSLKNCKVRNHP